MKEVIVVSGAPGSGKSTYVKKHKSDRDLVVDLDALASALSGRDQLYGENAPVMDALISVRGALYNTIKARNGKWKTAWVITTGKDADSIASALGGSVVTMDTSKDECKKRVLADDRRQDKQLYTSLIDQWFDGVKDSPPAAYAGKIYAKAEENTMPETVHQETTPAQEPEKTFTQAEVNAIVSDRLSRERGKYADYEDLKSKAALYDAQQGADKTDLQKAQEERDGYKKQLEALQQQNAARDARDKVAAATGVPANLLTGETEEACQAQAEAILAFKGTQPPYPDTHDGGEVQNVGNPGVDAAWQDLAAQISLNS